VRLHHTGVRAASRSLARAAFALAAGIGSAIIVIAATPVGAGATGDPASSLPPQVMSHCTTTPVDDTSAACIDRSKASARWSSPAATPATPFQCSS